MAGAGITGSLTHSLLKIGAAGVSASPGAGVPYCTAPPLLAQLPQGIVAGFQQGAAQEEQAETISPFMT